MPGFIGFPPGAALKRNDPIVEQSNLDQKPDGPILAAASCWCLKSDAPANAGARPQVLLSASYRLFQGDSYLDFSVSNIRQSRGTSHIFISCSQQPSLDVCSLLPQCIRGTRAGTLMGPFQILEPFPSSICARTEAAGRARPPRGVPQPLSTRWGSKLAGPASSGP